MAALLTIGPLPGLFRLCGSQSPSSSFTAGASPGAFLTALPGIAHIQQHTQRCATVWKWWTEARQQLKEAQWALHMTLIDCVTQLAGARGIIHTPSCCIWIYRSEHERHQNPGAFICLAGITSAQRPKKPLTCPSYSHTSCVAAAA